MRNVALSVSEETDAVWFSLTLNPTVSRKISHDSSFQTVADDGIFGNARIVRQGEKPDLFQPREVCPLRHGHGEGM